MVWWSLVHGFRCPTASQPYWLLLLLWLFTSCSLRLQLVLHLGSHVNNQLAPQTRIMFRYGLRGHEPRILSTRFCSRYLLEVVTVADCYRLLRSRRLLSTKPQSRPVLPTCTAKCGMALVSLHNDGCWAWLLAYRRLCSLPQTPCAKTVSKLD